MKVLLKKVKRRLWGELVSKTRKSIIYPFLYQSYWHYLFSSKKTLKTNASLYFAARPNPGAGIGHQLANWIAGYWWAKQFGLKFAHIPFSTEKWEKFFGFGEGEISVEDLVKNGYKIRRIPLFDEKRPKEVERFKRIMATYYGSKTIILCEQDQFYKDQFGVIEDIQSKFYNADTRKNEQLIFSPNNYNVAIHVRRGDIVVGQENKNPNLLMRYQNNDYFYQALSNTLTNVVQTDKPVAIYLFSLGEEKDFTELKEFPNLHFCLEMGAQESFLHMVYADVLITSKSSFSYKPALLNNGIKVCPQNFWHGYPKQKDWILANEKGELLNQSKDYSIPRANN